MIGMWWGAGAEGQMGDGRCREVHMSSRVCVSIRKEGRRDEWIGLERVLRK